MGERLASAVFLPASQPGQRPAFLHALPVPEGYELTCYQLPAEATPAGVTLAVRLADCPVLWRGLYGKDRNLIRPL